MHANNNCTAAPKAPVDFKSGSLLYLTGDLFQHRRPPAGAAAVIYVVGSRPIFDPGLSCGRVWQAPQLTPVVWGQCALRRDGARRLSCARDCRLIGRSPSGSSRPFSQQFAAVRSGFNLFTVRGSQRLATGPHNGAPRSISVNCGLLQNRTDSAVAKVRVEGSNPFARSKILKRLSVIKGPGKPGLCHFGAAHAADQSPSGSSSRPSRWLSTVYLMRRSVSSAGAPMR